MENNENFVYGKNPVRERLKIIKNGTLYIKKTINNQQIADILKKAKSKNIAIEYKDNSYFENISSDKNHQGLVLKIEDDWTPQLELDDILEKIKDKKESIILILDGIVDVGNLGAALRSALLFNVDAVILPKNNSAPVNDVVAKRSSGAVNFIDLIYVSNIVSAIEKLKKVGFWVYGADMNADTSLNNTKFSEKNVLIFGGEEKGIRKLVKENCDFIVKIPTNDKLDSLNISVSIGIFLYEINRNK